VSLSQEAIRVLDVAFDRQGLAGHLDGGNDEFHALDPFMIATRLTKRRLRTAVRSEVTGFFGNAYTRNLPWLPNSPFFLELSEAQPTEQSLAPRCGRGLTLTAQFVGPLFELGLRRTHGGLEAIVELALVSELMRNQVLREEVREGVIPPGCWNGLDDPLSLKPIGDEDDFTIAVICEALRDRGRTDFFAIDVHERARRIRPNGHAPFDATACED
jgi:hypothetical protein